MCIKSYHVLITKWCNFCYFLPCNLFYYQFINCDHLKNFSWFQFYVCKFKLCSASTTEGQGGIPANTYFLAPQFSQKIISNVLKLAQIWQFQHKNEKFLQASCKSFTFFCPLNFFSPSPPLPPFPPNFDAGAATGYAWLGALALFHRLVFSRRREIMWKLRLFHTEVFLL